MTNRIKSFKFSSKQTALFLILCVLFPLSAILQAEETTPLSLEEYTIHHWDLFSGLPSDSITTIFQDSRQFIWVGSYDGIFRYDGKEFTLFDQSNTPGLRGHSGNCFFQDHQDTLWIGSGQALIAYREGAFTSYTQSEGLLSQNIHALCEDDMERLWIGSNQGLQYKMGDDFLLLHGEEKNPFTGHSVDHLLFSPAWGLIATCSDGGIYIHSDSLPRMIPGSGEIQVSAMEIIDDGRILIGSRRGKLYVLEDQNLKPYEELPETGSQIRDIFYNPGNSNLWIVNSHSLYLRNQGDFHQLDSNQYDFGMLQNIPKALWEDTQGNTWLGTRSGGLYAFSPSAIVHYDGKNGLNDLSVNSVAEYPPGTIWIAGDQGLYCLKDRQFQQNDLTKALAGIRIKHLNAASGKLYVSTLSSKGVLIWDGTSIEYYGKEQGLPHSTVKKTLIDSLGRLWVSTSGGVVCRNNENETVIYNRDSGFISDEIYDIYEDSSGRIWVSTVEDGLLRIEANGAYQRFSEREGLKGEMVFSVREDQEGDFWVATAEKSYLIRADDRIFPLSMQQGLPYLYMYQFFPVADRLYMTSLKGFSYAGLQQVKSAALGRTGNFESTLYTWQEGLTASPNALSWLFEDSSGAIWIPANRGVSSFLPGQEKPVLQNIPVYITSLVFDGISKMEPAHGIELESSMVRQLRIDYSSPCLINWNNLRCRYQLKGYHSNWSFTQGNADIIFTGLKPGNYNLNLEILNQNDEIIGSTDLSFGIKNPDAEVWLYIILFLAVIFIIILLFSRKGKKFKDPADMDEFQRKYNITPREMEMLKLLLQGKRDKEIAEQLHCAVSTVSNTLSRIYKKTSTDGRNELIHLWVRQ